MKIFKAGDKIKLVKIVLSSREDLEGVSGHWIKSSGLKLNKIYTVYKMETHSVSVRECGLFLNPNHFELVDRENTKLIKQYPFVKWCKEYNDRL